LGDDLWFPCGCLWYLLGGGSRNGFEWWVVVSNVGGLLLGWGGVGGGVSGGYWEWWCLCWVIRVITGCAGGWVSFLGFWRMGLFLWGGVLFYVGVNLWWVGGFFCVCF